MKNKWSQGILLVLIGLFEVGPLVAQVNPPPAFRDSMSRQTELPAKGADSTSADLYSGGYDSLEIWKRSPQFSYIHFMDSLLRHQHELRSDTVHIEENTGRIHRSPEARNGSSLNSWVNSLGVRLFFWLLSIAFILLVGYRLLIAGGLFSRKSRKSISSQDEEKFSELETIPKYDLLIMEAEQKNDLNLAVRYLFLKTLMVLSEHGYIQLLPGKTNQEFIEEMKSGPYVEEFKRLARNYEFLWYGKFPVSETNYRNLKDEFQSFTHKI